MADQQLRASIADSDPRQDETARASLQDDASSVDKPHCNDESVDFGEALRHSVKLCVKAFSFLLGLINHLVSRKDANVKSRNLGVVFHDLEVIGKGTSALYQPTIGTIFNPVCTVENVRAARQAPLKTILTGFEGVVKPGEMLCQCFRRSFKRLFLFFDNV